MVWDVKEFDNGNIDIRKKTPASFINHYSFHIIDQKWGHITIKISGHPPFGAQIILNGHEWVERREEIKKLSVTKEGNCFTGFSSGEALSRIAETLSIKKGSLRVCVTAGFINACGLVWTRKNSSGQGLSISIPSIR